jgi:hypothetical protein
MVSAWVHIEVGSEGCCESGPRQTPVSPRHSITAASRAPRPCNGPMQTRTHGVRHLGHGGRRGGSWRTSDVQIRRRPDPGKPNYRYFGDFLNVMDFPLAPGQCRQRVSFVVFESSSASQSIFVCLECHISHLNATKPVRAVEVTIRSISSGMKEHRTADAAASPQDNRGRTP